LNIFQSGRQPGGHRFHEPVHFGLGVISASGLCFQSLFENLPAILDRAFKRELCYHVFQNRNEASNQT
jgi:hypothetical protein